MSGRQLHAVDLFAGCGGLSLGLRRAGFRVEVAVEIDPRRAETFARNHRQTAVVIADVRTLTGEDIIRAAHGSLTTVDLVAGCPPCEGFSRIRRRNRAQAVPDERNSLVLHFGRLVRELAPRAFMMENVPGLQFDARFSKLLRSLRGAGYRIDWQVLDLAAYGVPQRRRRVVVIGWQGDACPDLSKIHRAPPRTVRDAIEFIPRIPKALRKLHEYSPRHSSAVKRRIRSIPRDGGSRTLLPEALSLHCHTRSDGYRDVYGRMGWDTVAPTITGGYINPSKGRFLHPTRDRALTVLEGARIQTFPIWYRFDPSYGRYPLADMVGEALPPRFAQRAAAYIRAYLLGAGRE